jgi:hypothetical protein
MVMQLAVPTCAFCCSYSGVGAGAFCMLQVLIVLRTLLLPGKVPSEGFKPKQRMEALALEEQVGTGLQFDTIKEL